MHLSEYRQEIADDGEMLVNTTDELIELAMAQQVALDKYALERAKLGMQGKL